jgi:hypothetical protein
MIAAAVIAFFAGCGIAIGIMLHNAKPGWEDEAGFHRGEYHDAGAEQ